MEAVVLAAGEGVRMRPLTYSRPKVMLPIANKPILENLLIELRKAGIEHAIIVIGYHGETVRDYFGNGQDWGLNIDYITQRKQLGTAHALKMVEGLLSERFLVVNGDVLVREEDIREISSRNGISLSLIEVDNPLGLGVAEVSGDRVVRILEKMEKPPSNLVNAGLYLFTQEIFPAISQTKNSPRGEYEITDSLQVLIDQGYPLSYLSIDYWLDLSYPWDLLPANESLMAGIEPRDPEIVEENVVIKGLVSIGRGTAVKANSYIEGPVSIGENCQIGPNCYIRPSTSIGDNCHIGAAVEVKNSIIMNDCKIPHQNYIGDSVIGAGCNFGAGTKIANLRLDKRDIEVMGINTRRKKLGAIVGDGVQTGINASINVGSLIGEGSYIGPGAVVSGVILPNSMIF